MVEGDIHCLSLSFSISLNGLVVIKLWGKKLAIVWLDEVPGSHDPTCQEFSLSLFRCLGMVLFCQKKKKSASKGFNLQEVDGCHYLSKMFSGSESQLLVGNISLKCWSS